MKTFATAYTRKRTETSTLRKRPQIGIGDLSITARAKELVMEVLESNRLSAGPIMQRFEAEIAAIHGCTYGLMCNSGTSALQIALAALMEVYRWHDGDEILVPALTFIASSNVVIYNNLKPVFVDVDPEYYTIDPEKIEEKITSRTRGIMPVHIAGLPCDMDPILDIAQKYNLRIVEDSCETMFARYKGHPVGSFGDVGCFSTYIAHVITTGVGGLCTTSDSDLIVMLKSLMNHGRDSIYTRMDDDQGTRGTDLFHVVDRRFSFIRLGHSFRCTEMEAALGLAQLEERESTCARRQEVASHLNEGLSDLSDHLQLPRPRAHSDHIYMFYPITIRNSQVRRDDLILHLEEHGIETRYLLPLINQPIYRKIFGNLDHQYPVTARLNETAFYIGCHPGMSNDDVDYILQCFHTYFGGLR
jgi:dTDP-4-amino-4,6-dideoxygalactose transaminase